MRHRTQSAARSRGPARARVLRVAGCGVVQRERVALLQSRRRCTVPGLWGHVALSQRWLRDGVIPELGFEVSPRHGSPPRGLPWFGVLAGALSWRCQGDAAIQRGAGSHLGGEPLREHMGVSEL